MKSNVCKFENGQRDITAILKESERVAQYNGLTHKQTLQLRLLCEEIDGMLPNMIDDFEGALWIEFEDGVCKIKVSVSIPQLDSEKKEELIGIAKNKKNAAATGIVGKIRNSIEDFFLKKETVDAFTLSMSSIGYSEGVDYTYLWVLDEYRNGIEKDKQTEAWDELEKSVIASVADDVIVGVRGRCAEIEIIKNFA